MSYAGLGQTLSVPSATVGRDPSRRPSGTSVRVGARWAQRAVNAGNRYNLGSARLIAVDGRAGPVTVAGLRTLSHQFSSDEPVTNDPSTGRVTDFVIIPLALETALASKPFVPDPPTTARPTRTATPDAAPAVIDDVVYDEGYSESFFSRYALPLAVGGVAVAGLGLWFFLGGGTGASMRTNRRRTRRNPSRPLHAIAAEIRREWKSPYFGAVPYIQAMDTLSTVKDSYGLDRGDTIVAYFLGNATGWRGPAAKRIKAELNAALKERRR